MIGGGGSTANRTAAEVIGTAELDGDAVGDDDDAGEAAGAGDATLGADDDEGADDAGADDDDDGDAGVEAVCAGRCSSGLDGALCIIGRGVSGRGGGLDIIIPDMPGMPEPTLGLGAAGASPPRKSLTRVSTS